MGNADNQLTDDVKEFILRSGIGNNLKQVTYNDDKRPADNQVDGLKQQAQAEISEIQQLLNSGTLDPESSKRLSGALHLLQGALAKKNISAAELSAAITDAMIATVSAEGGPNSPAVKKRAEKLWHQVDVDNKDIDDDFTKMRKAGVKFNDSLWNRHEQLMADLKEHPHDLKKQKELDAVDDALLVQAQPQIGQNPDAKMAFNDATDKSKERNEMVNKALTEINKQLSKTNTTDAALDDQDKTKAKSAGANLTMDDVKVQNVGQKPKSVANAINPSS